jgi:hypothetical protein
MTKLESLSALWEIAGHSKTSIKQDEVLKFCELIKQEVDERYMLLPVDADGVPIRPDDLMACTALDTNGFDEKEHAMAVNRDFWVDKDGCTHIPSETRHVKPRTVDDVMSEYAELSASQDVKKYHEVSDELREMQREKFRDEPEREFFKEFNGYEFYIELPYDELCIGTERAWVKRHSYSYMYKKPGGGSVYSCSSLCGYSRDWAIGRINEEIARIESELQMRGDAE